MAEKGQGQAQQIALKDLPIPQLNRLSQQIEQEVDLLRSSIQNIKMVQQKFVNSKLAVEKYQTHVLGTVIQVPMSAAMYCEGTIADSKKVLVDIGTGYLAEKKMPEAVKYFERKIDFLTKQLGKLQPTFQEKFKIKQAVTEALQTKLQSHVASQKAAGQEASKT